MMVPAMFIGRPFSSLIDGLSQVLMCTSEPGKWVGPTKFGPDIMYNIVKVLTVIYFEMKMSG